MRAGTAAQRSQSRPLIEAKRAPYRLQKRTVKEDLEAKKMRCC